MEHKHALLVSLCAAEAAFALAHVFPDFHAMRVLWYYPLERRWSFDVAASGLGMAWYGRTVLATAAAVVAFAGAFFVSRRGGASKLGLLLWPLIAAAAGTLTMALYAWQLFHRRPEPLPLPSSHVENERCDRSESRR